MKIISKYYSQFLLLILAFSFFTRIYRVYLPEKYIFDEVYHAVTAKLIADNDIRAYEWTNPPPEPDTAVDWLHPPLAKYFQALSMDLLSQNSFGWRFSSVIFGVIAIFMTAKLALNLFHDKFISLVAALISSMDGLMLTMSRIAMNDIHVTVFILVALNFYVIYLNSFRKKYKYLILAAFSTGLAMGTKWSGLFSLLIIGFFETINLASNFFYKINKKNLKNKLFSSFKKTLNLTIILLILPACVYVLSYTHMFILGKNFNHLIEMHKNIWWYQTTLDATHPAQSRPIQWFLDIKPVWIYVNYSKNMRADIYAFGNPLVFWIGDIFIITSLVYLAFLLKQTNQVKTKVKKNKLKLKLKNLSFLLFSYFAVWIPWQFSPRIMFFYHYLPAVPLLSINMAYWLNKLYKIKKNHKFEKLGKISVIIILLLIIAIFILWYPHWTGIAMPIEFKDKVYFALKSWRQE